MNFKLASVAVLIVLSFPPHSALAQAAHRGTMTAAQWLQKERVRCLAYVELNGETAENIRRTRELGFNCVLSSFADVSTAQLMPLVNAADRYGVRVIWVNSMMNQFDNPALKDILASDSRRFVGKDGRISAHSACPSDPTYWKVVILNRAIALAKLAAEGHPSSTGLLLDMEDYSALGDWDNYCFCDRDFHDFIESIGRNDVAGIPSDQRYDLLVKEHLLSHYHAYQDSVIVRTFRDIRSQIDKIDPSFVIAIYPWERPEQEAQRHRLREVKWDERLAAGLGTTSAPFLFFIETTYDWGYGPFVEMASAQLRAKGLRFVAVPGFNVYPAERVWWPEEMARSAYYASVRSGGYWVFQGRLTFLPHKGDELDPRIGGTYKEWAQEFKKVNNIIEEQFHRGKPPYENVPQIPLPPRSSDSQIFQTSDLFSYEHSKGSSLLNREWSKIGLPWAGGELVFLAKTPGEWFSFEREIRLLDRYQVGSWFTMGPDRGVVQLYVDGKSVGEPVDLYAPIVVPNKLFVLGRPVLRAGSARLEIRVIGKNPKSEGYVVGLTGVTVEQIGWWPGEWNVILPFDNTGEDQPGYSAMYPPEEGINFDSAYTGKGGSLVKWQVVRANENGYLDFKPLVSDNRDNVAYVLVYAHCPQFGLRKMFMGTDDGGKLWVNDKFIWGENIARSARRNDDSPMAYFNAGWNKILIKVTQVARGWGLYFRIYDPQHTIRYSLRPQ